MEGIFGKFMSNPFQNERSVEIPALLDFVRLHLAEIDNVLDVGAHSTARSYAPELRKILNDRFYGAVDILKDDETEQIVDCYTAGNVMDMEDEPYDLVFSISSLEHSGISTYKREYWVQERYEVFAKMWLLTGKFLFVTFPFGQQSMDEGQFANITSEQLRQMCSIIDKGEITTKFYQRDSEGYWQSVSKIVADQTIYNPGRGVECICILEVKK